MAVEKAFPASYLMVLLTLAEAELIHRRHPYLSEVAKNTGTTTAHMSTIMSNLGYRRKANRSNGTKRPRGAFPPLRLIVLVRDKDDTRKKRCKLTKEGWALVHRLLVAMKSKGTSGAL